MKSILVRYTFRLGDGSTEVFDLELNPETLEPVEPVGHDLPDWTRLGFQQCPNCPLNEDTHPRCPLAARLSDVVGRFDRLVSHDQLVVEVITRERAVAQRTTAQKGIASLMGLIIATSGCPNTAWFKPMARFHLPFSSEEETVFRAASTFLLSEHIRRVDGDAVDGSFAGLQEIYETMHIVNNAVAKRLRAATSSDAAVNALVLLDTNSMNLSQVIEQSVDSLRRYFNTD
ncbi:MAG: hypothetical protein V3U59_03915 [Gammaproteobacteria bacterium]